MKIILMLCVVMLSACSNQSAKCDAKHPINLTVDYPRGAEVFCCQGAIKENMFANCIGEGKKHEYVGTGDNPVKVSSISFEFEDSVSQLSGESSE